jgi:D-3-phosphoglycerate dehydrogenase
MKILIADKVEAELIEKLEKMGAEVISNPDLKAEDLPAAIGEAVILVVRSTKVTADTINNATHLGLIIRAGAGVNTIDLAAASARGTYVANCPGMNTDAVAELAIGLLISADRGIADATQALRAGKWQKKLFGKGKGLKGRTLGIVGLGQIGLAVAKRAKGLEMEVLAWSRSLTPEKAEEMEIGYASSPLEVAKLADAVSIHLASNSETKKMIGKEFFGAMKQDSVLINTSRGEVIDEDALAEAVESKGIRAGLDVFDPEPAGGEAPFDKTDLASKVVCTPHIGASTEQAAQAILNSVLNIVTSYKENGQPPAKNVVNLRKEVKSEVKLVVRHFNRVGVLSRVLESLRDEGINIEEMQNSIFEGNDAACCSLALDKKPGPEILSKLSQDQDIIEVIL